jgi:hypothetical protein
VRRLLGVVTLAALAAVTSACGGGGSGNSIESFCTKAAAAQTSFGQLGDTASDSSRGIALFDDLTQSAPNEIKGDMQTILSFLRTSSSNTNTPSDDSVTAASTRVVQFFKDKCHVDLGASSSTFDSIGSSISN